MVIVREKIKIHNQIGENYSLCWFALTLDWSIQHNFATLLEVVRSPLILSISENGSSHISKKFFSLKIDYVVYQIDWNFALIKNNNRTWVIRSIVFSVFFILFELFYIACLCALFDLSLILRRIAYAYLVTLQFDLSFVTS